jgi:hypothetical protein
VWLAAAADRDHVRVAYSIRQPARAPDGAYYDVTAVARGDLRRLLPDRGPALYLSANAGVYGIVGFLVNLLIFRRRWRITVRPSGDAGSFVSPTTSRYREDVTMKRAAERVEEIARIIEQQGPAALTVGADSPGSRHE